jgi:hypothetical protein
VKYGCRLRKGHVGFQSWYGIIIKLLSSVCGMHNESPYWPLLCSGAKWVERDQVYSNDPGIVKLSLESFFFGTSPDGEWGVEAERWCPGVCSLLSIVLTSTDLPTSA